MWHGAKHDTDMDRLMDQTQAALSRARADLRQKDNEIADRRRAMDELAKRAAILEARMASKDVGSILR